MLKDANFSREQIKRHGAQEQRLFAFTTASMLTLKSGEGGYPLEIVPGKLFLFWPPPFFFEPAVYQMWYTTASGVSVK